MSDEYIDDDGLEEEELQGEEESSEEDGFPKWMRQLPEKLKNNEDLKQFKSIGELAEDRAGIVAKNEELQARLDKIPEEQRIPGDPSDYELELPDDLKLKIQTLPPKLEGFRGFYEGWVDTLKGWCHELGLSKTQATQLFNSEVGLFQKIMDAGEEHIQRELAFSEENQRRTWGPRYEENCEKSKRAMELFAAPETELRSLIDRYELGNQPAFIQHFCDLYKHFGEDSMGLSEKPHGPKVGDAASDKEQELRERYPNSPELWGE